MYSNANQRIKGKCFTEYDSTYIHVRKKICEVMSRLIDRTRLRAKSASEREEKAIDEEKLAGELLDTWKNAVSGAKGCTFYMHASFHHLPAMIRALPVDVILASGDSFEAKNQQLKKILRRSVSSGL